MGRQDFSPTAHIRIANSLWGKKRWNICTQERVDWFSLFANCL
jgi:hypothetical protein